MLLRCRIVVFLKYRLVFFGDNINESLMIPMCFRLGYPDTLMRGYLLNRFTVIMVGANKSYHKLIDQQFTFTDGTIVRTMKIQFCFENFGAELSVQEVLIQAHTGVQGFQIMQHLLAL